MRMRYSWKTDKCGMGVVTTSVRAATVSVASHAVFVPISIANKERGQTWNICDQSMKKVASGNNTQKLRGCSV